MRAVVFISTVQNPEETLRCADSHQLERIPENEIINDFDLIALEKAVQLKEAGLIDEIVLFSLAPSQNHLLKALAIGADRAVWGMAENGLLTPKIVADTAFDALKSDDPTIWMLGKIGVNYESHQTAQILAQKLAVPCLSSCFAMTCSDGKWHVDCEEDAGIAHYHVHAPFVVTAELRLAEPRFPSLPNIIKAKKKPIDAIQIASDALKYASQNVELVDERCRECKQMTADEFCDEIHSLLRNG